MRALVLLLAAATLATHRAYAPLSQLWAQPARAAEELFYVLRGVEGTVLFCAVLWLAERARAGAWLAPLALLAIYGAVEEALTAFCGAAYLAANGAGRAAVDASADLCDRVTGWAWAVALLAVIVLWLAWRRRYEVR